jgi:DNA-binding transcriptional MocR family regulator
VRVNLSVLEASLVGGPAYCLPAEAGVVAIIELPTRGPDDEALALRLLEQHGVFAQPGFWFDVVQQTATGAPAAHLGVSLWLRPEEFARGARALRDLLLA